MGLKKETLVAVLMAGAGIIAGNTVLDFTNDLDGRIFGSGGSTPSITFTCTPNQ